MVAPHIATSFSSIRPFKALVIGDFLLDTYVKGSVKRISPEAPVAVLHVKSQDSRPGGAGNVALNLAALGASVCVCGRIGNDVEGPELCKQLKNVQIDATHLLVEKDYHTPLKSRLIGEGQQLLRVDRETIQPLSAELEEVAIQLLETKIAGVEVVAISDYGKGFLTNRLLAAIIEISNRANVPVIVDPKGVDFEKYRGCTLLKPNMSEAYLAAKINAQCPLEDAAAEIISNASPQFLLITRSEAGMSLFDQVGQRFDFPVHVKEVKDVTGAGDTVLAMICLGFANQLDLHVSIQLANIAASLSIERVGCVQITLAEIAKRLLELNSDNKIFQEDHTFALAQVLQGRRYSVLSLTSPQTIDKQIVRSIQHLARSGERELVVAVKGSVDPEFLHLLSSMQEVSFVLLQSSQADGIFHLTPPEHLITV